MATVTTSRSWILILFIAYFLENGVKGDEYLVAVPGKNQGDYSGIFVEVGENGGQIQIKYPGLEWIESHLLLEYGRYTQRIDKKLGTTSGIENNSIIVSGSCSNTNALVYENNYQNNIFSPLPISALGKKYILGTVQYPEYYSYVVIATHNKKTSIEITFKLRGTVVYGGKTYSNGETMHLLLDKYQTFSLTFSSDVSGTVVTCTETVGLFQGMVINERVVAYSQLLPVEHFGKEFVVAVDDYPGMNQLQIISEASDTEIKFNNGSTVSLGDGRRYQQSLEPNESFHFTSSKPVMTSLFRLNGGHSAVAVVNPLIYQGRLNRVYVPGKAMVVKIITSDGEEVNFRNVVISWQKIANTKFKVGTLRVQNSTLLESDVPFTGSVMVYTRNSIFDMGNQIPGSSEDVSHDEKETYVMAVMDSIPCIVSTAGLKNGVWQIQYPNQMKTHNRNFPAFSTDLFLTKPDIRVTKGIENKAILVTALESGTEIYQSNLLAQYSLAPVSVLGTKYIVPFCPVSGNNTSVLVIVTHEYKTDIGITFRLQETIFSDRRRYSDGDTLSVTLETFQTFTFHSSSSLCGTVIKTRKSVAVFIRTYSASASSQSGIYTQLLPVNHYGDEFIIPVDRYDKAGTGYFQIHSADSDTEIIFNNKLSVSLGETHLYTKSLSDSGSLSFRSSKPVITTLCGHVIEDLTQDSCTLVAPISQYRNSATVTGLNPFLTNIKIMTNDVKADVEVQLSSGKSSVRSIPVSWEMIKGTPYKVGTCKLQISLPNDGSILIVNIQSDSRFSILGSGYFSMFNGGYSFINNVVESSPAGSKGNTTLIVGLVVGCLILVLVLAGIAIWKRKSIARWVLKRRDEGREMSTRNIAFTDKNLRNNTLNNAAVTSISFNAKQTSTSA